MSTYGRRSDCASRQQCPPVHSVGHKQWGWYSDRLSGEHIHKHLTDRGENRAPSPQHHDTPARPKRTVHVRMPVHPQRAGYLTQSMQSTWKVAPCMMEHSISAYSLLCVYVVQGSGGAPLGREQRSVVNFRAKEGTLFSTSPSGVVKSSCWFQVNVPHSPRTLNTGFTFFNSSVHWYY